MRLVTLPSDATKMVDLDSIVAVHALGRSVEGTVALPTTHGTALLAVSIGEDDWALELELASGSTLTWQRYDQWSDAVEERAQLARLIGDAGLWRRRFSDGTARGQGRT